MPCAERFVGLSPTQRRAAPTANLQNSRNDADIEKL